MSRTIFLFLGLLFFQCPNSDLYSHLNFQNGKCVKTGLKVICEGGGRSWIDADDIQLIDSTLVKNTSLSFLYKGGKYYIPISKNISINNYKNGDCLIIDVTFIEKKDRFNFRYLSYVSNVTLCKSNIH